MAAEAVAWWRVIGGDHCQQPFWNEEVFYPARASIGNVIGKVAEKSNRQTYQLPLAHKLEYEAAHMSDNEAIRKKRQALTYCSCNITVILSNIWKPEDWPWPTCNDHD
ncbi:hypothetical protein BCR37DRAFT_382787 [Protomyces lactucae-debilis]|uniref:Uncharacterized protein n=1 Tax=Protomyces lactucae-debilis TaxID=2754530 RepID=A0A1Y2F0A1_PROLT|nr:uncharacterized protein BCR37DRAFT_382787 [Protomyces lactucae-debilis]ORY77312.1 hypothetical protein BCR37DRAFT_382787 [Protomyces lactucae-debilis]